MMYPLKNVVRLVALAWICHGHVAHPPSIAVRNAPLWMLSHRGAMNAKSLLLAMELVLMLVPSVARPKAKATKNAPARLVQRAIKAVGSQERMP